MANSIFNRTDYETVPTYTAPANQRAALDGACVAPTNPNYNKPNKFRMVACENIPQRANTHMPFYTCARGTSKDVRAYPDYFNWWQTGGTADFVTCHDAAGANADLCVHAPEDNSFVYLLRDNITLGCYEYERYADYYDASEAGLNPETWNPTGDFPAWLKPPAGLTTLPKPAGGVGAASKAPEGRVLLPGPKPMDEYGDIHNAPARSVNEL